MNYSEYIKSILDTLAKNIGPNAYNLPSVLMYQLSTKDQVHPTAKNQLREAVRMAIDDAKYDELLLDYFKLLRTQVDNLDFGIKDFRKGIVDAIPLLNNHGVHNMSRSRPDSFSRTILDIAEFFNGTDITMRKIKPGILDSFIEEMKSSVETKDGAVILSNGAKRRKLIAELAERIPDNLLLFMMDVPNKLYNASEIVGENDLESLKKILDSVQEYNVEEFLDDKFYQELSDIVEAENLIDARDFWFNNSITQHFSNNNIKIINLDKQIIGSMLDPLVELTRVFAAESVTFRNAVQNLRILSDDNFLNIIDNFDTGAPNSKYIELLQERGVVFDTTKEFAQGILTRLRKGAEMYSTFNFEELLDNPNFINKLQEDMQILWNTFSTYHDIITTRMGEELSSPAGQRLFDSEYKVIFKALDDGYDYNPGLFGGISEYYNEVDKLEAITDTSPGIKQLGLFNVNELDFIEASKDLLRGNDNFINFLQPEASPDKDILNNAIRKIKNKNVPVDNGFDIFSFKPPANEIFHAGPSLRFLEEVYNIKDIGDIELWDWETGSFTNLTGKMETIQDDMWKVASQVIGDIQNADALIAEEALGKGIELPDRLIIKVNKPSVATSQALLGLNNKVAVPNQVKAGDRIAEVVKNMDADKLEDVVNILKTPKLGSAISSTAIDYAKKAGKFTGGTALTALAPGDVAIELGLKRLLPKLGLAAISGPALALYTAYELALLAADAGAAYSKKQQGEKFWDNFGEVSDKYSIGYKLTKEVHNTLFEDVYGRIAQDLYAGTDS
jgi:predicted house-cleaning noncanonical NTP pyrophosphatase (MazG superfamily)